MRSDSRSAEAIRDVAVSKHLFVVACKKESFGVVPFFLYFIKFQDCSEGCTGCFR